MKKRFIKIAWILIGFLGIFICFGNTFNATATSDETPELDYGTPNVSNHNVILGEEHELNNCIGIFQTNVELFLDACKTNDSKQYYYLEEDITITKTIVFKSEIHLCLNGHIINLVSEENASVFRSSDDTSADNLNIYDCNSELHKHYYKKEAGLYKFFNEENEPLTATDGVTGFINGGLITGGKNLDNYGGAFTIGNNDRIFLFGGTIAGNTASFGGAIGFALDSTIGYFVMNGGRIIGNKAIDGGGIHSKSGTQVTINGGLIADNLANSGNGGAIYISGASTTFNLYGGSIVENRASSLEEDGGNGGGIAVYNSAICYIRGGNISANVASSNGGGLYGFNASIYITDGTIGGIRLKDGKALAGNKANTGGGAFITDSRFSMIGGSIGAFLDDDTYKGNNVAELCNGLYVSSYNFTAEMNINIRNAKFNGSISKGNNYQVLFSLKGNIDFSYEEVNLNIINSEFKGNDSVAIFLEGIDEINFEECLFENNNCCITNGDIGKLNILNCQFFNNASSSLYAGTILDIGSNGNAPSEVKITGCTIKNNINTYNGSIGAIIHANSNGLNITDSIIEDNEVAYAGGIIYASGGYSYIISSQLKNNKTRGGYVVYFDTNTPILRNAEIKDNFGIGVVVNGGRIIKLEDKVIVDNNKDISGNQCNVYLEYKLGQKAKITPGNIISDGSKIGISIDGSYGTDPFTIYTFSKEYFAYFFLDNDDKCIYQDSSNHLYVNSHTYSEQKDEDCETGYTVFTCVNCQKSFEEDTHTGHKWKYEIGADGKSIIAVCEHNEKHQVVAKLEVPDEENIYNGQAYKTALSVTILGGIKDLSGIAGYDAEVGEILLNYNLLYQVNDDVYEAIEEAIDIGDYKVILTWGDIELEVLFSIVEESTPTDPTNPETPTNPSEPQDNNEGFNFIWLIILIVILVVFGCGLTIFLIVYKKRKNDSKEANDFK